MRLLHSALVFAVSASFFAAQQPGTPEKCVVQGRVLDASSGAPVRKAVVLLSQGGKTIATMADSEGRFALANVPPGGYRLHANRDGYIPGFWTDPSPGGRGPFFVLEPGQRREDFVIRLSRHAVIFGKISDEGGDPVADAWVYAIEFSRIGLSADYGGHTGKETNDLGEYRIYGLPSGRYAICARRRDQVAELPGKTSDPASNQQIREVYVATCYPNTTDPARASAVALGPGAEVRIDLTLLRSQAFLVRGRVQIPAGISAVEEIELWLSSPESGATVSSEFYSAQARGPEYGFEFRNVRPGSYILKARAEQGKKSLEAKESVEVGAGDVVGIVVAVLPGAEVSGRVHFPSGEEKSLKFARVELDGDELYGQPGETGELRPDGSFRFDNIWTGTYRVEIFSEDSPGRDAGLYVRSASLGGRLLANNRFKVVAGEIYSDLEIWVARSSAVVAGVVSRDGRPTYGATVCLFPDDRTPHSGVPRCIRSDEKGAFRMERARPGRFRIIALEEENDLMFMEKAQFWELLEKDGNPVLVEEDSQIRLDLRPVPRKSGERK